MPEQPRPLKAEVATDGTKVFIDYAIVLKHKDGKTCQQCGVPARDSCVVDIAVKRAFCEGKEIGLTDHRARHACKKLRAALGNALCLCGDCRAETAVAAAKTDADGNLFCIVPAKHR